MNGARRERGFTLYELLVSTLVVAVALLAIGLFAIASMVFSISPFG